VSDKEIEQGLDDMLGSRNWHISEGKYKLFWEGEKYPIGDFSREEVETRIKQWNEWRKEYRKSKEK
jgi:hypothetical protein